MDSIYESQVFFLISSVGFIILGIMIAILIVYLIRAAKSFERIMGKMERDINTIGDTTKEMLEEVRDSGVFRLIFRNRKKHTK